MKYINDAIGFVGLGMVGAGLWLYDARVALVVVGAMLLALAYKGAVNSDP